LGQRRHRGLLRSTAHTDSAWGKRDVVSATSYGALSPKQTFLAGPLASSTVHNLPFTRYRMMGSNMRIADARPHSGQGIGSARTRSRVCGRCQHEADQQRLIREWVVNTWHIPCCSGEKEFVEALSMELMHRCGAIAALSLGVASIVVYADQYAALASPAQNWQIKRLMMPSDAQLAAENKGQVYIYDSLDIDKVNNAMDQHFDRIQYMMFTHTHYPPKSGGGQAEVEDEGCD
jgi:hypothetical protein